MLGAQDGGSGPPANGSHGFYNELFAYGGGGTNYSGLGDFDQIDVVERARLDPGLARTMHADLLAMIAASGEGSQAWLD